MPPKNHYKTSSCQVQGVMTTESITGATKHYEDSPLWQRLEADRYDFPTWELLIRNVETRYLRDPKEPLFQAHLRDVMSIFLQIYPLCFGYWKRWAELAMMSAGTEEAIKIWESGIEAVPQSVDLWVHYIDWKVQIKAAPSETRTICERAEAVIGHDFTAGKFWEKFLEIEAQTASRTGAYTYVFDIFSRVLRIPLQQISKFYDKYNQYANNRPAPELVGPEKFNDMLARAKKELANDRFAKVLFC